MYRCKGITKNGLQCKRNMIKSNYCKQHQSQKNNSKICTLPYPIISQICIFLDPLSKKSISTSCKHFYNILLKKKYIKSNNLNLSIKPVTGDGNCGVYTIFEFLKNKMKNINVKKIQKLIKKYIDYKYEDKKWLEILDIVKILDYFGFGTIFKIDNFDSNIYLGYNIKDNYKDICFINYINELHFELLLPKKIM